MADMDDVFSGLSVHFPPSVTQSNPLVSPSADPGSDDLDGHALSLSAADPDAPAHLHTIAHSHPPF